MPSTEKKPAPKKATAPQPEEPTAAEAAAAEANDDDIKLTFRGFEYVIPRKRAQSPHFRMAIAAADLISMVYTLLREADARRFLLTVGMDEDADVVADEFLRAFGAAAGQGNSSASG